MTSNSAEEIIERFGGIRPMAGKLGIPVTTVQGWKKRNFIPPARLGEIQQAAEQNNIDISDLIDGLQNQTEPVTANARPESARPQSPPRATQPALSKEEFDAFLERKIAERMAGIEKKTVTKGAVINAALLVLTLVAGVALLWPYKKMPEENQQALQSIENKIGTLQGDLAEIKEEQSFIDELKQDAAKVQQGVQGAITQAQEISGDLSAGTLEERIAKLEGHIGNNAASSMMSDLLTRYQSMMGSAQGDAMLGGVVQQLNAMLPESGQNKEEMDVALQKATEADPAIGATFEGVPPSDLKAAAFLLGMTQFRSSLGRDNKPFADDLGLLVKLSGENDPALKESILKLAPYAEQGILTPHGLGNEFKAITGDVVVASLKGEDVSVKDKAKARLNEVFKVEKNGELVTGTPTQATLAKTEDFLNTGNIEAAIIEMKKLQGPAGGAAAPWINQAEATLMAQKLKLSLSHAINAKAAGSITAGGGPLIPGTLIQNEDTGINIYKKN